MADTSTEKALPGALVSLLVDSQSVFTTRTDAAGEYVFFELPGSSFDVEISKSGYAIWRRSAMSKLLLDPAKLVAGRRVNAILTPPPTVLNGRVLSIRTGAALPGAAVWTYPTTVEATTDSGGYYEISSVNFEKDIDFHIQVSCVNHVNFQSVAFHVETGDTLELLDVSLRESKPENWDTSGVAENANHDTGNVVPGSGQAQ